VTYAIEISYIVAAILFIRGLKMLSSPATARRGNMLSALGMLVAVIATLVNTEIITDYRWIAGGVIVGAFIGSIAARIVPMTSMPEFVALFNGSGGVASLLVGWSEYQRNLETWADGVAAEGAPPLPFTTTAIYLAILIGGVTASGSLVAYGKLSERINSKPYLFSGQQIVNAILLLAIAGCGVAYVWNPTEMYPVFLVAIGLALVLGVMATIPIGGADMPVVISLLNSYSGLAACAAGFVINNTVLIVSGSLVGASGIVLTAIMCKAMNRSLTNVLFSGFGSTAGGSSAKVMGEAKPVSAEDTYYLLEAASSVVFVPGYGMAVAQAQHVVRELGEVLEENGCDVRYAIHPVAGRMPGHMNVLLAEANVPYEQLVEMEDINPQMDNVDVAVVIGANDVVNPAAREDENSPIYGMPIINVDHARTVIVLKRSMASGFAGVDNPLLVGENTRMLFGDAKASLSAVLSEFKES
jgi:H+-translocating NAD(P) transhydrogenase subunit beta